VLSFAIQKSRVKTMRSIIKVGQRFKFTVLTDDAPTERQGVVIRVLSNREEGLGLDVDQYMSYWVEAHELPETEFSTNLVFVRSADEGISRWQSDRRHLTAVMQRPGPSFVRGDSSILARHYRYKRETKKNEAAMVTASSSRAIYRSRVPTAFTRPVRAW